MKRRNILTFSLIFTIALCLISFMNIPSVPAYDFNVVDYYDNTSYYTLTDNQTVTIQSSFATSQFYADSPIIACSVYRSNFSFLSLTTDSNHYSTTIYKYNFQTGALDTVAIRFRFFDSPYTFAADASNRYYMTNDVYTDTLYCYSGTGILQSTIKCNGAIRQIMCIDGVNVTVITSMGYYVIKDCSVISFEETKPAVPCTYKGFGLVIDNNGIEYDYKDGALVLRQKAQTTTAPKETEPAQNTNIYIDGNYIYVPQGTTVAKLKKALGIKDRNYTVTNYSGKVLSSGKIGTRTIAYFEDKPYTVIVIGDITGEGNINSRDLKKIMKHLVDSEKLDEIGMIAGDINSDNKICAKDITYIMKLYE